MVRMKTEPGEYFNLWSEVFNKEEVLKDNLLCTHAVAENLDRTGCKIDFSVDSFFFFFFLISSQYLMSEPVFV